ncbi:hypothetical protein Tco_0639673 [Tanacetum coccineum]
MFLEEKLMSISDQSNEPWYADYANYLASRVLPVRTSRQEKQKFFSDLRHYFWDEPYLFKQCADQIIWRCAAGNEASLILQQCHSGPSGIHQDELRLEAYKLSVSYKERTKRWHDKRINPTTEYEKGDKVLLFNSRLKLFPGKLKSRWYGPFTVSRTIKSGAIELCDKEGNEFIINRQRMKPYSNDLKNFDSDDDIIMDNQNGGVM